MKEKIKMAKGAGKLYDVALVGLLMLIINVAPFATYTYKKSTYTISGITFLKGKVIMGGEAVIAPNATLWAAFLVAILIIVVALLYKKIKGRPANTILGLLAFVEILLQVLFALQVNGILKVAKKAGTMYGPTIVIGLSILIMVRCLYNLYHLKVLTALDFMLVPGLLYLIINNYLPMVGVFIAFKKIDFGLGIWGSKWVGLDNFKYLFTTADAWIITRNTLLYNLVFIIVGNIMGIIVGICLSELINKKLQKFYQTTILLPQLISMIIVAYIVFAFLSNDAGFMNLSVLGEGNEINFYSTRKYWPFFLVVINTWKGLGYSSIIYLSSVIGIDRSLYEASYVDGAGRWTQIKHITIPLLKPTVITLVLLQVGRIFYSDFGLFYQVPMDSGSLYPVTNTIDTYVYRALMKMNNISMASAASTYQAVIGFALVLVVNGIVRKADRDNALF